MPMYRKKPVIVEARLFNPDVDYDHAADIINWCGGIATEEGVEIPTLEGTMLVIPSDYVIKGIQGEFYPCKPDIFEATYELA